MSEETDGILGALNGKHMLGISMKYIMLIGIAALASIERASADPGDAAGDQRRAGYAPEVSRFAKPSDTGRYTGYLVGGGARRRQGDQPLAHEGAWGWDYSGGLLQRRVILGWWHGRRYQGGPGAYPTDGPKVLPELER